MFRNLAASAGTEYMFGALHTKVSTNASGSLGAVSMDVHESKEPRMFGRTIYFIGSVHI